MENAQRLTNLEGEEGWLKSHAMLFYNKGPLRLCYFTTLQVTVPMTPQGVEQCPNLDIVAGFKFTTSRERMGMAN